MKRVQLGWLCALGWVFAVGCKNTSSASTSSRPGVVSDQVIQKVCGSNAGPRGTGQALRLGRSSGGDVVQIRRGAPKDLADGTDTLFTPNGELIGLAPGPMMRAGPEGLTAEEQAAQARVKDVVYEREPFATCGAK